MVGDQPRVTPVPRAAKVTAELPTGQYLTEARAVVLVRCLGQPVRLARLSAHAPIEHMTNL